MANLMSPIALAGGLSIKKAAPFGLGTLRDDTFTFGGLLMATQAARNSSQLPGALGIPAASSSAFW